MTVRFGTITPQTCRWPRYCLRSLWLSLSTTPHLPPPRAGERADAARGTRKEASTAFRSDERRHQGAKEAIDLVLTSIVAESLEVQAESAIDAQAVSGVGAQGLTQLMPRTAALEGVSDARDARQNVVGGTKCLSQLLDRFDGDIALAGYNAGPTRWPGGAAYLRTERRAGTSPGSGALWPRAPAFPRRHDTGRRT